MDFERIAIALGDVTWIFFAFIFGFLARLFGLPPLVGYLAAGFLLSTQGIENTELLLKLADTGVTLLLFIVGLKLKLRTLAKPQVWAVASIHMLIITSVFGTAIYGLAVFGISFISELSLKSSLLIGFALSFSSTVFAVKILEERGGVSSLYGRIAIGILIIQDLAAVIFLALSLGKLPSLWSALLLLFIPLKPLLYRLLNKVGHGELLILYGFMLALGGAKVFELVGVKGDLGALILGVMMAGHVKSDELTKSMLDFKDLFLLGFFLSIGLSGYPTLETSLIALIILPLVLLKSALFFTLLTRFNLRARTSLLTTLSLTNYSEFGLIVAAIGVKNGWINNEWLIIIALALSISFVFAAGLNAVSNRLYTKHQTFWKRMQRESRLPDDQLIHVNGATIAIIGMGRVGTGAYNSMQHLDGEKVIGVDIDPETVENLRSTDRNIILGDPSDPDFWDRLQASHTLELVMLALPKLDTTLAVIVRLKETYFTGCIATTAKFPDEVELLKSAGATLVFNVYAEAGTGFATHVMSENQVIPEMKINEVNFNKN